MLLKGRAECLTLLLNTQLELKDAPVFAWSAAGAAAILSRTCYQALVPGASFPPSGASGTFSSPSTAGSVAEGSGTRGPGGPAPLNPEAWAQKLTEYVRPQAGLPGRRRRRPDTIAESKPRRWKAASSRRHSTDASHQCSTSACGREARFVPLLRTAGAPQLRIHSSSSRP